MAEKPFWKVQALPGLLCAEMISEHGVIIHVQLGNKADVDD